MDSVKVKAGQISNVHLGLAHTGDLPLGTSVKLLWGE